MKAAILGTAAKAGSVGKGLVGAVPDKVPAAFPVAIPAGLVRPCDRVAVPCGGVGWEEATSPVPYTNGAGAAGGGDGETAGTVTVIAVVRETWSAFPSIRTPAAGLPAGEEIVPSPEMAEVLVG